MKTITLDSNLIKIVETDDNSVVIRTVTYKWIDITNLDVQHSSQRIVMRVFQDGFTNTSTIDFTNPDVTVVGYTDFETLASAAISYQSDASVNGGIDNAPDNYSSTALEADKFVSLDPVVLYSLYAISTNESAQYIQVHELTKVEIEDIDIDAAITIKSTGHGLLTGDKIYITGVTGMIASEKTTQYTITEGKDANHFTIPLTDEDWTGTTGHYAKIPANSDAISEVYPIAATSERFVSYGDYGQLFDSLYICNSTTLATRTVGAADTIFKIRYKIK